MRNTRFKKRILSFLLASIMLFSSVSTDSYRAYASAPETPQQSEEDEDRYVLYVNGMDLTAVKNNSAVDFASGVKISYGTNLSFSAKKADGVEATDLVVFYGTNEDTIVDGNGNVDYESLNTYTAGDVLPVGDYYIFYDSYEYGSLGKGGVVDYALRVEQKKLAAPSNLAWGTGENAMTASWDAVTTDVDGQNLIGEDTTVSYRVSLYYGAETEAIYTSEKLTVTSLDLKDEIMKAQADGGKGYGDYTFKVEVVSSNKNYASVSATVAKAYTYKDTIKPEVTSYQVLEEDGVQTLQAHAVDTGIGIKYYAFAPSSVSESSVTWQTLETAVAGEEGYTAKAKVSDIGPGTIYFYAKDEHGNVACQQVAKTEEADGSAIVISKVTLKNYYSANVASEPVTYLVGNEGYTLPTAGEMARTGYTFTGWYDAETGGTAHTAVTPGESTSLLPAGSSCILYGRWETQTVSFSEQPGNVEKVYDANASTLTAALAASVSYDSVSWQWYYKESADATAQPVEGATGSERSTSLTVCDVKNSGYYYAVATIKVSGMDDVTATSDTAQVTIEKRPLNIRIQDEDVTYMDEAPEAFSFELGVNGADEGLVGEDTLDSLFATEKTNIKTTYVKGNPVKEDGYPITYDGIITKDNYAVTLTDGTLTVLQMDLTDSENVTVTLSQDSYAYDGDEKEPEVVGVTLQQGVQSVTLAEGADKDYTYSYRNNVKAEQTGEDGTAVIITFGGNYTGTIAKTFTITKSGYDVQTVMSGWKYGETAQTPGVDVLQEGTANYYYLEVAKTTDEAGQETYLSIEDAKTEFETVDKTGATTIKPVNAGRYYVWAVIPATDNYNEITAKPAVFDITPREIVITASSRTWAFDENTHSDSSCTITGDGFVGQDDFQWYTATGSIREIGEVENVVTYKLTSATLSRNYHITVEDGTLRVTATKLVPPSTFNWSSTPGTLSWIAITKDNLNVQYELKLYRTQLNEDGTVKKDSYGNILYDETPVAVYQTQDGETSHSFLQEILADSATTQYGYAATIQVFPKYAENEKHNYEKSDPSPKLDPRYTAKVTLYPTNGVDSCYIVDPENADNKSIQSVVLFQGQSVNMKMTSKEGYSASYWYINPEASAYADIQSSLSSANLKLLTTGMTKPEEIQVSPVASDQSPVIYNVSATMNDSHTKVQVAMSFGDTIGLDSYAIIRLDAPLADGAGLTILNSDWKEIPKDEDGKNRKSYVAYEDITENGFYYVCVKDTGGNARFRSTPVTVYKISFDKGVDEENAESVTGEMSAILKLKDEPVELPANNFVRAGYGFTNWTGSTGIYAVDGTYVANANDTLVAGWTDAKVSYKVRYFYQQLTETVDAEGNPQVDVSYVEDVGAAASFTVAYGTVVSYNNAAIQAGKTGYTLTRTPDGIPDYAETYRITEDNQEICLYYNLEKYTITYTYTDTEAQEITGTQTYYYGQTVQELAKPKAVGYTFVGWNWGDAGQAPATMPNNNLKVTGSFKAEQVKYYIVYYMQDLDQSVGNAANNYVAKTFSKDNTLTEEINASYAEKLLATVQAPESVPAGTTSVVARSFTGFTPVAVQVSYKNPVTTDSESAFDELVGGTHTQADGTVQKALSDAELDEVEAGYKNGPTYICFYYKRNIHTLTMDVYKDARENNVHLFGSYYDGTDDKDDDEASWVLPYGYQFASEDSGLTGDGSDGSYKASYFETYGYEPIEDGGTHSKNWTKRWPTGVGVTSKEKYYLADFVDWSCGQRPTTMPDGDVSITREYASKELAKYNIEVYIETVTDTTETVTLDDGTTKEVTLKKAQGTYSKAITYERYGQVGQTVKIVDTMPAEEAKEEDCIYITVEDLAKGVTNYKLYEHNPSNDLSYTIEDSGEKELLEGIITENVIENNVYTNVKTLRLNLVRKEHTSVVRYHELTSSGDEIFAYRTIKQKWGTTYLVDPLYYFDGKSNAHTDGTIVSGKEATAANNFRNNNYVVSYNGYYWLPNSGHGPNKQYTTYQNNGNVPGLVEAPALVMTVGTTGDGTEPANPGMNSSRSYMDVYYSAQEIDKHYYLKLKYEQKNSGTYTEMKISEVQYPALADVTDDKTEYQVCVVNKCDVFKTSGTTVGTGEERYPGSKYLSANSTSGFQYTYEKNESGEEILRAGFVPVTLTYDAKENKGVSNPNGTRVTGTATFYLYVVDGVSDGNLYAIDESNPFYNGNRLSFSYNTLLPTAHVGRDYFMAETNRPESGRVEERANSTAALYNIGIALDEEKSIKDLPSKDFNAYYYDVYNDYYITYHYDGQSCSGSPHDNYSYNQEITDFTCNTFSVPEGYHIAWYMDAEYTTPVHAFNITGPTNIYGRREKNPVENWDYVFYKLPAAYEGAEWITLDNVESFTWTDKTVYSGESLTPETVNNEAHITGLGCETITKSVNVDYVNEMGITTTMAGLRTEWYINGQLVMAKQPNYSMTFIEFYMDPSKYAREGFTYDATNVKNKSKAFCTTTPVNMYAYFTRTSHTLTVSRRNAKIDNDEVSTKVYGALIRLEDPVKEGYEFDGWKLQQVTVSGDTTTYTDLDESLYSYAHVEASGETPGYATFFMPACDTIAIAQWKPIEVEYEIVHYLQDDNKTYKPDLLQEVLNLPVEDTTVELNGSTVSAKIYKDGETVKAISYTNGDLTYYYTGMDTPAESESYKIETADAFAVVQKVSNCKSEDTPAVSAYALNNLGSMFSLAFAKYEHDTDQLTLSGSDTFTVYHDMLLSYYYERSSSIQIRAIALSSDAGDTGLTLSGAGNRYYGEKFNLYAVMQPNGYTFLGWFNAKDVLKDYPTDGSRPESLSGMVLADGVLEKITADPSSGDKITPACADLTFPIVAKESQDYVAITAVTGVTKPTVTVKSTRILTQAEAAAANAGKPEDKWVEPNPYYYQYEADASNVLTATVNWGEAGAAGSSVKGYKWYCKYYAPGVAAPEESSILTSDMEEIPNSNSGTYLFPTGKDAGTYVYRCVVEVERKDNGRKSSVEGTYTLEVHPCETYYKTYPADVKYDGASHACTDYFYYGTGSNAAIKGYYSKTEITADISAEELTRRQNLQDDDAEKIFDSCAKVTFTDVKVKDDRDHTVIPNVVYYYIQSTDPNYASVTGSEDVLIQPVEVSVAAKKPFTKIYDGTADVQGSYNSKKADGTWSDFHRLLTGSDLENGQMYYEISGILPCDQDKQLRLNFTASFDSEHVLNATTVTLDNMWVAQIDLNRVMNNYNYRFPENAKLQLSGQIKPYPLSVKWIPTQTSNATADYTTADFKYNYDGTEKSPYVVITENNPPDDKSTIVLTVGNVQKNVGTYEATVEVSASEHAEYYPSDYTFTLTKQTYEITSRYIKVCPKDVTKVYNGSEQTMVKNETVNEFRFFTKENASDDWTEYASLPTGETFAVSTDKTGKNVGTYTITAKDIVILNSQNKNINDNYQIEYGSGELTIIPCPVVVSGIVAEDKNYDKKTTAELVFDGVQFSRLETVYNETTHSYDIKKVDDRAVTTPGLYAGDALILDTTKVTGAFADAKAGNDKTVNLTIDNSSAAANGSGGALLGVSRDNYRLVTDESQKTTQASILAGTKLTVSVDDLEYVYGEQPRYENYELSFADFIEGDSVEASITQNQAVFVIKKKLEDETYQEVVADGTSADMKTLPAGDYYIFLKENTDGTVVGLLSDDYTIEWDKKPAKLTVKKRPVRIVAKTGEAVPVIEKEYDNTTTVLATAKTAISANDGNAYYAFAQTLGEGEQAIPESGIVNNDDVKLGSYTAVYDSKDVATATKVKITDAVLAGEKAANYMLVNTAFDLKGKITAKVLTIKIDDAEIVYGNPAPEYTYTLTGVVASEKTEIEAAVKTAMHPVCAYTNTAGNANRVVGTYAIDADDTNGYQNANCYQNPNYTITYTSGTLTVKKRIVFYKADDKEMIYQKDDLPTYTGAFMSDNTLVDNDGWVYGEGVNETGDALVQLYTDEACSEGNAVSGNNYTFIFKCYEHGTEGIEVSATTPAGDYNIVPDNVEGKLFAKNYEFKKVTGTLTINKYYLRVYNVEVLGKIYDGTTTVDEKHLLIKNGTYGNFDYKGIKFTFYKSGSLDETKFYTDMTPEEKDSLDISAKYQSAGVGDNKLVDVSIKLKPNSYLDKRYILLTEETKDEAKQALQREDISEVTQTKATAFVIGAGGERIETAIQPRPLTLYPTDATIKYGETLTVTDDLSKAEVANHSVVVDKKPAPGAIGDAAAIGFVEGEGLTNIGFSLSYLIYETALSDGRPSSDNGAAYAVGSDVGSYAINISSSHPQGQSGNYDVSYEKGLLTVAQNQFPAPTVTWDTTNIGTVNWTEVAKIGNVDVANYIVTLYKDGTEVESVTVDGTARSHDFSLKMHESAGAYTVKVHAIASTDNNVSYKNVKEVGVDGTSAKKYAANVTVKFDETAGSDTVAATTKTKIATITASESKPVSYIMIAGEKDVPVAYEWGRLGANAGSTTEYRTGYAIDTCTVSSGLTLGIATDNSASGSYSNTVSLAENHASVSDLSVTLKLKAREATLAATVKETHATPVMQIMYGYDLDAVVYKVEPAHSDMPVTDYVYTYEWTIKRGTKTYNKTNVPTGVDASSVQWDKETFQLPKGFGVYSDDYQIICKVTATRKDNGESMIAFPSENLRIIKARLDERAIRITAEGWTYGEDHTGKITAEKVNSGIGDLTLYYKKITEPDTAWTQVLPTDVGTYEAKAVSEANDNYESVTSTTLTFTINQATLAEPTNLSMTASDTAPYGLVKWNTVAGPEENAGASDSKSHIDVQYKVTLKYKETDTSEEVQLGDTVTTSETQYDFTDRITQKGTYYVYVQAVVKPRTNQDFDGQDTANCADSTAASYSAFITIGAEILSNGTDTANPLGFTKEYDGSSGLTMTVEYSDNATYQWYKNGDEEISGATERTYTIYYVEENANYVCKILPNGSDRPVYTKSVYAAITPRPVTIKTNSNTKVYDGTALTDTTPTLSYTGNSTNTALGSGDTMTSCTVTGSATYVADTSAKNNTYKDLVIKHGDKVVYEKNGTNNNYVLTEDIGTLTITKRPIAITADSSAEDEWTYDETTHTKNSYTYTQSSESPTQGLASGDVIASVTITGSIKDVGTVDNVPSNCVIRKGDAQTGMDVTANYNISYEKGTLKVTQADASITLSGNMDKIYDGVAVSDPTQAAAGSGTGTPGAFYTKTGDGAVSFRYYTKTGETYTELAGAPKDAGTYYVKAFTAATRNYKAAESDYLQFTISKREVTLTATDKSSVYGQDIVRLEYTQSSETKILQDELSGFDIRLRTDATSMSPVGDSYTITISYTENENYTITTVDGKYTITNAEMTVTADGVDTVYDGGQHGITVSATANAVSGDQSNIKIYYSDTTVLTADNYATAGSENAITYKDVKMDGNAVGSYTVYYYVACPNYEGKAGSETVKIKPREVSFTVDDKDSIYGQAIKQLTYQKTSELGVVAADETALAITPVVKNAEGTTITLTNSSAVGDYRITLSYNASDNYKFTVTDGTYTIGNASLNVTAGNTTHVYDGTGYGISVNASADAVTGDTPVIYYSETELTADNYTTAGSTTNPTYTDVKLNGNTVESYTVYYYVACPNYTPVTGSKTVTITKRPLRIQAGSESRDYNGSPLTFEGRTLDETMYSLVDNTSLAGGDTITGLLFSGTITNVGTIDNVPSACVIRRNTTGSTQETGEGEATQTSKDVTANYDITYINGTLEVTQAQATISLTGNMDKTYDGLAVTNPAQATAGSGTGTPGEAGGTGTGAVYTKTGDGAVSFKYYTKNDDDTYTELAGAPKNAGTYYVKAFTAATHNYKAATSDYLPFTIGKRAVTLTATDTGSVYGQPLAELAYTQSSSTKIVSTDLAGFNIQLSTTATSTKPAGNYPIEISYIRNSNYEITTEDGTYTISNAQLRVQAEGITKEYDGNTYGIAVTADANAVPGDADNIEIYYSTTELTAENYQSAGSTDNLKYAYVKRNGTAVSDYTVYYYVVCDSYDGVAGSAKVRITPRALTIKADSAYAEYNPSQPLTKNSYTLADGTSLLAGDKITDITITGSQDIKGSSLNEPSNAVIHNRNGAGDNVTGCYEIEYQPGTLAVGVTLQEITAQDMTLVYDGAIHDMHEVVASTTGDSTLVYTATLDGVDAQEIQDPGILYITITAPETDRYAVAVKYVKLTITQREITVTAESDSRPYDGMPLTKHAYEITDGSLAQTDEMTVTYTEDSTITHVGETQNVVDTVTIMRGDVDVTGNYIISTETGTLTVEKRSITIQAQDKTKVYDGTPLTYEEQPLEDDMYDISDGSLAQGDTVVSLDFAGRVVNAESVENVVSQAVIVNELDEDVTENYDISYENGTLTVTRADAEIRLTGKMDKTYDGKAVNAPVPEEVHPAENVACYTKSGDGEVSLKYYTKDGDTYTELETGAPTAAGTYYVKAFTSQTVNYEAAESDYLKFTIAKRELEITAKSEHKVYDGKPLTFVGRDFDDTLYSVTAGNLASEDEICSLTFEGSITDAGTVANTVQDAVIKNKDGADVSESYDISYIAGKLTVEEAPKPAEVEESETTPGNTTNNHPNGIPVQEEIIIPGVKPGEKQGSLIVSTDTTDRDSENQIDKKKHFNVFLPDKELVAKEVLSDAEWKLLESGGSIEIRLMINRSADTTVSEELSAFLEEFGESKKKAFLKANLDLTLEKKVLGTEWERIFGTKNAVPVTIQIPEEFLVAGETLYLIRQDKDGFVILEDIDSERDTITFMTDDFEAVYALIAVADEVIATDTDVVSDEGHQDCFWHFIILLMLLLSVSVTIVYWKKDDGESTENVSDRTRKVRRKGYGIFVVVFNGIGIICVILGSCKWDLPLAVISIVLTAAIDGVKTIKNRKTK